MLHLNNVDSSSKININFFLSKLVTARKDNLTTLEKPKEHDFDAKLDLLPLENEIDIKEEPLKELQNMLEDYEMIKPKVSEYEEINLEVDSKPRMIRISPSLSTAQKEETVEFLSEFKDVLTWKYWRYAMTWYRCGSAQTPSETRL